jgi:hypothetical protein
MIFNCVSLSIKKKNFFIYLLKEIVLISSFSKLENFFLFTKKYLRLNEQKSFDNAFSKSIFLQIIQLKKTTSKKDLFYDIFKIFTQKFFFFFLCSFPCYIINESDFEYLLIGILFYFLKIPNNMVRFTGSILAITIIDSHLILFTEKRIGKINLIYDKRIGKILRLNSIKEISILGIIKLSNIESKLVQDKSFVLKKNKNKILILFTEDILISVKNNLKRLKISKFEPNLYFFFNFYKFIFFLNFIKINEPHFFKTFSNDDLEKKTFLKISKNTKNYLIFCEFVYTYSLKLSARCLRRKLKNYFHVLFYIKYYFFFLNIIRKYDTIFSNGGPKINQFFNRYIKMFGVLELISKNGFCLSLFLGNFLKVISSKKNLGNKSKILFWLNFLKKFLGKFKKLFLGKIIIDFKDLSNVYPIRVIVLKEKTRNFPPRTFWFNNSVVKAENFINQKLLKKLSPKILFLIYFKFFNLLVFPISNCDKTFCKFSFLSGVELIKAFSFILFFTDEKIKYPFEFLFIILQPFKTNQLSMFNLPSNLTSTTQALKRFIIMKNIYNKFKSKLFLNFFLKTQLIPRKICLISKKIKLDALNFFSQNPLTTTIYFSLFLQTSRKKSGIIIKTPFFFSIKENEFLKFKNFFEEKSPKGTKFIFPEFKSIVFSNFLFLIKNLILFKETFLVKKAKNFFQNYNKFSKFLKIYLNSQLNGNFLIIQNVFFFNIKNSRNKLKKRVLFTPSSKKILNFLIKLPFKTCLDIFEFLEEKK